MDNFDDMKAMWIELNQRVSALEEENREMARRVMNKNYTTARQRLVNKYLAFMVLSFIMIGYMWLFILFNPFVVEKYKLVTAIYWSVFFMFEATIDGILCYRIKKIDLQRSTVSEIAGAAKMNWKIHKMAIIIGIPLAMVAIILFGLLLDADKYVLVGMIIGGIVGVGIGLMQLKKFWSYYRLLQSNDV